MIKALIKSMRPKQWAKNVFILAALVFDRQLTNPSALIKTLIGFILFCLLSSAVYLINDIADIEADKQHPTKRNRPIASGKLPKNIAIAAAVVFVIVTIPSGIFLAPEFAIIAALYFLLNLAYSQILKHIPIIDVLVLASFYVIRVIAGVCLIQVERFSPWLYVCTTLLALFIGLGKRRAELTLAIETGNSHRRVLDGYTIPFLDQLITIVSSTTIISYSLYTFFAPSLPQNHAMMLTIPFVLYAIFRYLYLVQVKNMGGAPEDVLFADKPILAAIMLWGLSVLINFYLF